MGVETQFVWIPLLVGYSEVQHYPGYQIASAQHEYEVAFSNEAA